MHEKTYLIQIIKYLLKSADTKDELQMPPEGMEWNVLFRLAKKHGVANLLALVFEEIPENMQPQEKLREKLQSFAMYATAVEMKQRQELETLLGKFDENHIYSMPVKGSDTRSYYPKREWRTMGDLDILYRDEQHKELKQTMMQLGYTNYESGLKHDHYSKPPYINVEMHRALVAANTAAEAYYADVWERAISRAGYQYAYQMSLEDQYIYTMIHLLEHFKEGGIGIRFVMDVYVFLQRNDLDKTYLDREFAKLGMTEFVGYMEKLALKWFSHEAVELDAKEKMVIEELADFIISNGVYGSRAHAQAIAVEKEGRLGYVRRVIFPNLNSMQSLYPWLKGKAYLLPAAWFIRIIRTLLFRKKRLQTGMNTVKNGDMQQGKELRAFYERCGVKF